MGLPRLSISLALLYSCLGVIIGYKTMPNTNIEWVRVVFYLRSVIPVLLKGQMHHHDDLGSKCAYTCHLSNKTTRKSVLLSTPQIWLMKVSKKLA